MTLPDLTPEQEAHAQELARTLHKALEADILQRTRLLAARPDHQVLGRTEFQIRDIVHQIGAKTIQDELDARQKNSDGKVLLINTSSSSWRYATGSRRIGLTHASSKSRCWFVRKGPKDRSGPNERVYQGAGAIESTVLPGFAGTVAELWVGVEWDEDDANGS